MSLEISAIEIGHVSLEIPEIKLAREVALNTGDEVSLVPAPASG